MISQLARPESYQILSKKGHFRPCIMKSILTFQSKFSFENKKLYLIVFVARYIYFKLHNQLINKLKASEKGRNFFLQISVP